MTFLTWISMLLRRTRQYYPYTPPMDETLYSSQFAALASR
jgi:hypothetical protein